MDTINNMDRIICLYTSLRVHIHIMEFHICFFRVLILCRRWWIELLLLLGYGILYLGFNFLCHYEDGVWAYPFQESTLCDAV